MLRKSHAKKTVELNKTTLRGRIAKVLAIIAWVTVCFVAAQLIVVGIWMVLINVVGVPMAASESPLVQLVVTAAVYTLMFAMMVGIPWAVRGKRVTREDLGLAGLPTWRDLVLPIAGFVIYMILAGILTVVAAAIIPGFDISAEQDVGFKNLVGPAQYMMAFIALVALAPFVEEVIFRGYLYTKLKNNRIPVWLVILIVSLLFGVAHGQWNVAVNTFALGIVLGSMRAVTGTIWSSIILHSIKNAIAFYLLFVNTGILNTLGG